MKLKAIVGTSGWMYDSWKGKFYPKKLKKEEWLNYFSEEFDTVEINNSFYNLPSIETFEKWKDKTSEDFTFSVKANRYITHMKKLSDPSDFLIRFLNNISVLKDKLGPLLFQLPPFWHKNTKKLKKFVAEIPTKYEVVFEFRHPSWYDDDVYKILEENNIALCIHDHADGSSSEDLVTSDFSYIRFHGPDGRYSTKYDEEQLKEWVKRINNLKTNKVYCYFNNDNSGYAIDNAKKLRVLLVSKR